MHIFTWYVQASFKRIMISILSKNKTESQWIKACAALCKCRPNTYFWRQASFWLIFSVSNTSASRTDFTCVKYIPPIVRCHCKNHQSVVRILWLFIYKTEEIRKTSRQCRHALMNHFHMALSNLGPEVHVFLLFWNLVIRCLVPYDSEVTVWYFDECSDSYPWGMDAWRVLKCQSSLKMPNMHSNVFITVRATHADPISVHSLGGASPRAWSHKLLFVPVGSDRTPKQTRVASTLHVSLRAYVCSHREQNLCEHAWKCTGRVCCAELHHYHDKNNKKKTERCSSEVACHPSQPIRIDKRTERVWGDWGERESKTL